MSNYVENGSGGLNVRGCALERMRPLIAEFHVGDVAYSIDKARRDVREKVVIKLIRPVKPRKLPVANKVLYQDTLNGLWNEYDLVTLDEASALSAVYRQKRQDDLSRLATC